MARGSHAMWALAVSIACCLLVLTEAQHFTPGWSFLRTCAVKQHHPLRHQPSDLHCASFHVTASLRLVLLATSRFHLVASRALLLFAAQDLLGLGTQVIKAENASTDPTAPLYQEGKWEVSGIDGIYSAKCRYSQGAATMTATFNVPVADYYNVYATYCPHNVYRTTRSVFVIDSPSTPDAEQIVAVNQRTDAAHPDGLEVLHSVFLNPGPLTIQLRQSTGDPNGTISIDAFVLRRGIIVEAEHPESTTINGTWTESIDYDGYFGSSYLTTTEEGATVDMKTGAPRRDIYSLFLLSVAAQIRDGTVDVIVYHALGSTPLIWDQHTHPTFFAGSFTLDGASHVLIVVNGTGDRAVVVDGLWIKQADIADNDDASRIATIGSWGTSTNTAGYLGTSYAYTSGTSDNTFVGYKSMIFKFEPETAGIYTFSLTWRPYTSRATNALCSVFSKSGDVLVTRINQRKALPNGMFLDTITAVLPAGLTNFSVSNYYIVTEDEDISPSLSADAVSLAPRNNIVYDADVQGVTLMGTWDEERYTSSDRAYSGSTFLLSGDAAASANVKAPHLEGVAEYDVYISYVYWSSRSKTVRYESSGPYAVAGNRSSDVDQSVDPSGTWQFLHRQVFGHGQGGLIMTNQGSGKMCADAYKYVFRRRVPSQLIDAEAPHLVTFVGSWALSSHTPGFHGLGYFHDLNEEAGRKSVTYHFTVSAPGRYRIYSSWAGDASRASDVPIMLLGASGYSFNFTIDQSMRRSHYVVAEVTLPVGALDLVLSNDVARYSYRQTYVIADMFALVMVEETCDGASTTRDTSDPNSIVPRCRLQADCPLGTFRSDVDECTPCTEAQYTPVINSPACFDVTTCSPGAYERIAPTLSTDRKCQLCEAGTFLNDTSGQCQACTANCADDELVVQACTRAHDLQCEPRTECAAYEFEADTGVPGQTDRTCTNCTQCSPGAYVASDCSSTADRKCAACDSESFSSIINAAICQGINSCLPGHYQLVAPTSSSDAECQACAVGKADTDSDAATSCVSCGDFNGYQDQAGQATCKQPSTCAPGAGQSVAPTSTSDRECAPCEPNRSFHNAGTSAPTCQIVTLCGKGYVMTQAPTTSTDRVCSPCPDGTFKTTADTLDEQGLCQTVTSCEDEEYAAQAATLTSDVVCQPAAIVLLTFSEGISAVKGGASEQGVLAAIAEAIRQLDSGSSLLRLLPVYGTSNRRRVSTMIGANALFPSVTARKAFERESQDLSFTYDGQQYSTSQTEVGASTASSGKSNVALAAGVGAGVAVVALVLVVVFAVRRHKDAKRRKAETREVIAFENPNYETTPQDTFNPVYNDFEDHASEDAVGYTDVPVRSSGDADGEGAMGFGADDYLETEDLDVEMPEPQAEDAGYLEADGFDGGFDDDDDDAFNG
ncbi:uncharacterized protein MONBRDRAFT_8292 [Monosiga brevicollis MX1]|uniref:TNFR-Cys domain-containing protein n=1 Tax=Monosiga brevicollis TaxID=81824 RepID=A9UZL9_MONBE|nr:uncharacterized protein MONBRDRAFT_8292 [Monosiga brevicollis MX1]EDQ89254.1 predicted protein [Monosiga brevicollis MX1]|eukprot:XP_001745830.1 hypothetical protein [Monosiga brevicollis MX1]